MSEKLCCRFRVEGFQEYKCKPVETTVGDWMANASLKIHAINEYDLVSEMSQFLEDESENAVVGVYCFYGYDLKTPLYVGENIRMKGRLRDHLTGSDSVTVQNFLFLRFRKVRIYQLDQYDLSHRKLLEQIIIFDQKPIHNLYKLGSRDIEEYKGKLDTCQMRDDWPNNEGSILEKYFPRNYANMKKEKDRQEKKVKTLRRMKGRYKFIK